jgi:signal transduction histidine kinase
MAEPVARLPFDGRKPALRLGAFAALAFLVALAVGAEPGTGALVAAAVAAAALVERVALRGEASQRAHGAVRESRAAQRDAVAPAVALELALDRANSVLESLREGVLVVDDDGVIVLANGAARRAMRASALDPSGQRLWDALVPELSEHARNAWSALHEAPRSKAELPQIRYAGVPCRDDVFDLTAAEATSARTGQRFGIAFLLVDATRNHELQRLKDRFLSSVSHELRTPLTNICAYAELLRTMQPGDGAEWAEFLRVVHEEGLQLSGLVDGMFDYLQLESGEARFASEPVDGEQAVRTVAANCHDALARRRHDFAVAIAPDAPRLVGDRRRLEQVVRNLLDNAIKFTPEGGSVRVHVSARDEGWELRVEDSGPGVPPADRGTVFDRFSQLHDHMTDKMRGAGLGLATSRAIVTCLGGLIWCEDSPLGGAAFVVLLPGVGQPRLALVGAGGGF